MLRLIFISNKSYFCKVNIQYIVFKVNIFKSLFFIKSGDLKTRDELKKSAIRTLETEYEAIKKLVDFIDDDFASCVIRIY